MTAEVKRADIWIACLGTPKGSEQRGIRPVLVIQNDVGNEHSPVVIVAAITRTSRRGMPTHVPIPAAESGLPDDSMVLLEQIRTIDKTALRVKVGSLPERRMLRVDYALMVSLGLIPEEDAI